MTCSGDRCDFYFVCHCKGVELELRKLEGAVEAIHENLLYLKSRFVLLACNPNYATHSDFPVLDFAVDSTLQGSRDADCE